LPAEGQYAFQQIKNTFLNYKETISKNWFAVIVLLAVLSAFYANDWWKQTRQTGDGMGYYLYLPALFIYNDIGDYTATFEVLKQYQPNQADPREDIYGFRESPTGKVVNKYPVGGAILQAPFFFAAHLFAVSSSTYAADGFSLPYQSILFFLPFSM